MASSGKAQKPHGRTLGLWRPGAIEVLLLLVLVGAVVVPSVVLRSNPGEAFERQGDAIDRAQARAPLGTPAWKSEDLGFAVADMPGPVRTVQVAGAQGKVDAAFVGGQGRAVAVVLLPAEAKGVTGFDLMEHQIDTLIALEDELGVEQVLWFDLIEFRPSPDLNYADPSYRKNRNSVTRSDAARGEHTLLDGATWQGQTLRVRQLMIGDRQALVVSAFPEGQPDEVIDRVAATVKAS